jgi:hypothetical protein
VVGTNDPFDQLDFLREQEFSVYWHLVETFPGDTSDRHDVRRMGWKRNQVREGSGMFATENSEVLWKSSSNGPRFVGHFLVCKYGERGGGLDGVWRNPGALGELLRHPLTGYL